jgi:hypothetical protein
MKSKDSGRKSVSDLSSSYGRKRTDLFTRAARTVLKIAHKRSRRAARTEIDRALVEMAISC